MAERECRVEGILTERFSLSRN